MELFSLLFISDLHAIGCNFNNVNCKLICPFDQHGALDTAGSWKEGFCMQGRKLVIEQEVRELVIEQGVTDQHQHLSMTLMGLVHIKDCIHGATLRVGNGFGGRAGL